MFSSNLVQKRLFFYNYDRLSFPFNWHLNVRRKKIDCKEEKKIDGESKKAIKVGQQKS